MKKLTLLLLIALPVWAMAQKTKAEKWVQCSWTYGRDTTEASYYLKGKDSLSYTISTQNCNCDFYTTIGDHKTHPCKGLKLKSIEVNFMYFKKDAVLVKGVKISETKPYWDTNMSQVSNIEGVYEQNGKIAYIHTIHLLKHKLINHTEPYKFEAEWVIISEY